MRKHFLILMLFALLPLAGWAATVVDISGYQINLSAPSATYSHANVLPTVTLVKTGAPDVAATDLTVVWKNSANATVTEAINAGTYTVTVTAKEGSTTGTLAVPTKTFTVNKKTVVLKVQNLASHKVYGFKSTNWAPSDVAAVWSVSTEAGEGFCTGDDQTGAVVVVADWGTDYNAGTHDFTLSVNALPNYALSFQPSSAKWYMDKKDLLIAAEDKNLTYGDEFEGSGTVTYTGFIDGEDKTVLNGELTFTTNYEVGSPVSGGPYSYMPTGLTSNNYNITFNNGNINVAKKSITELTIDDIAAVTYNKHDLKPATISATFLNKALAKGADKDYVLSYYSSATIDATTKAITAVSGDITSAVDAETYYVKIEGKNNFNGEAYKAFTINKKPLAVITKTIDNKTYTGAEQKLVAATPTELFTQFVTFDGLVPADAAASIAADEWGTQTGANFGKSGLLSGTNKLTLTLTKGGVTATAKDVDNYTITVTGDDDAFINYAPTYVSTGLYKITKKTVTITAKNQSKKHGETHLLDSEAGVQTNNTTTATEYYANWVTLTPGDILGSDVIATYPVVKKSADGTQTIASGLVIKNGSTPAALDITEKNYKVEYLPGTFTENKGTINIIANAASITYGEEEPAMTATITGLANGELTPAIQAAVNAKVTIKQANHTDAGVYDLEIADVKDAFPAALLANYNETINLFYESAKYTVNQKALTKITANQQSLAVGDAQSALVVDGNTVTIEGALEGDEEAILGAVKLKFNTYVNNSGAADPLLTAVPAADVADQFVKATSTYLKGIVFDTTADLGNYTFPAAAAKIVAGNLVVSAADAAFTFDIKATTTDQITNNVAKKLDATISTTANKRNLFANQWNAVVLPFDITPYAFIQAIGTYAVFDVLQTGGDALNFKITLDEIPAYTPFLVKVDKKIDLSGKTFDNVVIKAIDEDALSQSTSEAGNYKVVGTLKKDNYGAPSWTIQPNATDGSINLVGRKTAWEYSAFTAYVTTIDGSNPVQAPHIFIEEPDGSTTAISTINADGVAVKAEGWYTINGMKLESMPTEKGVYINNGKKIVVK